ncbi:hypothetical protein BABINDRAFT_19062, partial [Babjeviella inositovora NRRL Y-12698]
MQYVGRAIGSVSTALSSINPSTLSGAIDIVVVEHPDGSLSCSPFHVRFGKFQLLRPSQKKIDVIVNGSKTNLPMKLGDGGEAFFVFETDSNVAIPENMVASPVLSAASSPSLSPQGLPSKSSMNLEEPDLLDLGDSARPLRTDTFIPSPLHSPRSREFALERAKTLSDKLKIKNIPSKIDVNGDLLLDMDGYKLNAQNIQDSDELIRNLLKDEFGPDIDIELLLRHDDAGKLRINNVYDEYEESINATPPPSVPEDTVPSSSSHNYFKTLRLTSEQLQYLLLKPGENDITYSVNKGKAFLTSKLFLWKSNVPIVISDIDGTITKSDALGHVLTMIGRDWTHVGVARLFHDIHLNGYNVLYLTARSSGQADSTRAYLKTIDQDGIKLPPGPVILSPDRTMAALRREVILKKPEVFKISCLRDFKSLYDDTAVRAPPSALDSILVDDFGGDTEAMQESKTPFYAGFGNRITDALSYRTVGIPSSRIFTINPNGEVHMELLELAGYKLSYVNIGELVDQFFPQCNTLDVQDERFSDVNFWREGLPELSESSD